ncbi:complex I NDUFA9 subunit family protein [Azohydromonas caseinilytica]|uniref:Complex I NDUFA9 subunit family protein n=1 Tax=Azohydromonas caseinilytica TaxID=2728836 RepID=A0A848F4T5_9BURK|nr:complex I NDUFA9 subunit family protein [Azohydromonas caseinilytica]NML13636.1 complex I NDUFA9 subunit family protein [Azohydromonas caseinilytica]
MQRLLILGGTGFVGRALCAQLAERHPDTELLVPTRHTGQRRALLALPDVELAQADIHDEAALARLLPGCDAAINLVGILHGDEQRFRRVHAELPRKLAHACRVAGVRRVLHVSAMGAAPDAPSRYLRSKAAGEAALQISGLDATIVRPSVIFGEEDQFLNLFARLQRWAPVLPLAGAHARFQPVWVQDVARALLRSLEDPRTIGQTYELAGPRVYTLAELARLAGQACGHERPVIALPDALARLQAGLMHLLPGEPLMSGDNLDSMKVDNVASGRLPGLQDLGIQPTAVEAVVPEYLSERHGCLRLNDWRARARRG